MRIRRDEIKHVRAKEVAEKYGMLECGTMQKDILDSWRKQKVKYEDVSLFIADMGDECFKYGKGKNTKYLYRKPIKSILGNQVDHWNYGIFTQEPNANVIDAMLTAGNSLKYDGYDATKKVGRNIFKEIFGVSLPKINWGLLFQKEEELDIGKELADFLETTEEKLFGLYSEIGEEYAMTSEINGLQEFVKSDEIDLKEYGIEKVDNMQIVDKECKI